MVYAGSRTFASCHHHGNRLQGELCWPFLASAGIGTKLERQGRVDRVRSQCQAGAEEEFGYISCAGSKSLSLGRVAYIQVDLLGLHFTYPREGKRLSHPPCSSASDVCAIKPFVLRIKFIIKFITVFANSEPSELTLQRKHSSD